ncbi:MAG: HPr family phosphocarrier protein [Pseudomonadaceae bacterium]|nr:HPr family phosphocarrier protein [Pseudomonadaceae bacterium]
MTDASLTVVNKLGLHARAASKLVSTSKGFGAKLTLTFNDRAVDAKSIMGVMTLGAPYGSTIDLRADGADADAAIAALSTLFAERFGEDE